MKPSSAKLSKCLGDARAASFLRIMAIPKIIVPIRNRSQTTVSGDTSRSAILVAMKEAPQKTTARVASTIAMLRLLVNRWMVNGLY